MCFLFTLGIYHGRGLDLVSLSECILDLGVDVCRFAEVINGEVSFVPRLFERHLFERVRFLRISRLLSLRGFHEQGNVPFVAFAHSVTLLDWSGKVSEFGDIIGSELLA